MIEFPKNANIPPKVGEYCYYHADDIKEHMKKGLNLTLTGESSRGTITNDNYSLKGFTAAINKLNKDC